jgi:hypothetical protein
MMTTLMFAALPALLIYFVLIGAGLLCERRARRENARRQAAYRADGEQARRDGRPPPFPPNVVRCQ